MGLPFLETPRFNTEIRYGVRGGPNFSTDVVTVYSGQEQRNVNWYDAKGRWTLGGDVYTRKELDWLIAFFRERQGRLGGFRFKDWSDWYCTAAEGVFIPILGNPGVLQMAKLYKSGNASILRLITKPVYGSIRVFSSGAAFPNAKIDYAKGWLEVSTVNPYGFTWSGQFDVPVRFDVEKFNASFDAYRDSDGESLFTVSGLAVVELPYNTLLVGPTSTVTPAPTMVTPGGTIAAPVASDIVGTILGENTGGVGSGPPVLSDRTNGPMRGGKIDPATPAGGPMGQSAADYVLIFSDEFNGTALDPTVWHTHYWYQEEPTLKNYTVENGALKIWPDLGFVPRCINTDPGPAPTFPQQYGFSHQYGFWEIEAKMPIGKGVQTAAFGVNRQSDLIATFLLFQTYAGGVNNGWATSGFHPNNYSAEAWRWYAVDLVDTRKFSDYFAKLDLSAAAHKYGMKWDINGFTFYFDGIPLGTYIPQGTNGELFINFALTFGGESGTPTTVDTPLGKTNAFEINYVRVWKFS